MKKNRKELMDEIKKLEDPEVKEIDCMYEPAHSRMQNRTKDFKVFDKIAHMMNLYDAKEVRFSEGSTQSILRKARAQTIQRAPDGKIVSPFDEESFERIELDFLFNNKILDSEYYNQDLHKSVWRLFTTSWIYGFAATRTGFERDKAGDMRICLKEIPYTMIYPEPDCDYIESAEWYFIDEMISLPSIRGLVNEKGKLKDSTYNQKVIDFILENEYTDEEESTQEYKISEERKGISKTDSIKIRTLYRRGDKEFITYVPSLQAKFRTVKNYDPQNDLPLHFLILEPDSSFTLGLPSILPTLTHQQFADAFQSSAYQQLLLSINPPLKGWGNLTPSMIRMKPGAWWNLGTNQNNNIEKFTVETTSLTQMGPIQEQISANMAKNMNIMDATIASDAAAHSWSKTPQGVEMQQNDKTITINQYQQRVENWFNSLASHAIRSLVSAFAGKIEMTVDEETRRQIADLEEAINNTRIQNNLPEQKSIIKDNKITIDFSKLSGDNLFFKVRTGSFIQGRKEEKRQAIQEMLVSVSQSMGNISEGNRKAFEDIILELIERQIELADIDFKASASKRIDDNLINDTILALVDYVKRNAQATQQLQQIVLNNYGAPNQAPQPDEYQIAKQEMNTQQLAQPQSQPQMMEQPQQQAEQNPEVQPLPPEIMQQLMAQQSQEKPVQNEENSQAEEEIV